MLAACGRVGFDDRTSVSLVPDGATDELGDLDALQGPGVKRFEYRAAIATCINPTQPDLTSCESLNGAGQLVVDGNDGTTNDPWQAYVRFDLDDAFAGKPIAKVTLRLKTTDDGKAQGPDSGAVWRVMPFTLQSLATQAPPTIGIISPTRGSLDANELVEFPLPIDIVGPSVYLGIITDDQTGGVNYWNLSGPLPPTLVVETN